MDKQLKEARERNVQFPTIDRPTWLLKFDWVGSLDDDVYDFDVEVEFEDDETVYIISIFEGDWKMDGNEFTQEQLDEIISEAIATADAYELFTEENCRDLPL